MMLITSLLFILLARAIYVLNDKATKKSSEQQTYFFSIPTGPLKVSFIQKDPIIIPPPCEDGWLRKFEKAAPSNFDEAQKVCEEKDASIAMFNDTRLLFVTIGKFPFFKFWWSWMIYKGRVEIRHGHGQPMMVGLSMSCTDYCTYNITTKKWNGTCDGDPRDKIRDVLCEKIPMSATKELVPKGCPNGWKSLDNNTCFYISNEFMDRNYNVAAERACIYWNAEVLNFKSEEEYRTIRNQIDQDFGKEYLVWSPWSYHKNGTLTKWPYNTSVTGDYKLPPIKKEQYGIYLSHNGHHWKLLTDEDRAHYACIRRF